MPVTFLSYGLSYKKNFLKNQINLNPITIRVINSNISLDRFFSNNQTSSVLKELIEISAPDLDKRIFFLWPEGILPGIYQDELDLYKDFFKKNFNENHYIGLGINNRELTNKNLKIYNSFSIFDNNSSLKLL